MIGNLFGMYTSFVNEFYVIALAILCFLSSCMAGWWAIEAGGMFESDKSREKTRRRATMTPQQIAREIERESHPWSDDPYSEYSGFNAFGSLIILILASVIWPIWVAILLLIIPFMGPYWFLLFVARTKKSYKSKSEEATEKVEE